MHVHVKLRTVEFDCLRRSLPCFYREMSQREFGNNLRPIFFLPLHGKTVLPLTVPHTRHTSLLSFCLSPTGTVITLQREKSPKFSKLLVQFSKSVSLLAFTPERRMGRDKVHRPKKRFELCCQAVRLAFHVLAKRKLSYQNEKSRRVPRTPGTDQYRSV